MKNTELLEILGNIDDKFYNEALGGDPERPVEISIKKPVFSIKNVLVPAAACLAVAAVVGVTAHFLNKAGFINPNPATSNPVFSDVALENPEITPEDFEQCKKLIQKYLPSENIEEFDFDSITGYIDIDFDGADEVVITPRTSDSLLIVIFDKTVDGMVETAHLSLDAYISDSDWLYVYDSNGERYYYFPFYRYDLNGIEVSAATRIKYNEGEYSIDYPLVYGYHRSKDQWFFMTDCAGISDFTENPVSNISAEEFKAKWAKHIGLPRFNYYATFDEEYPLLSEIEIPIVESSHLSADNYTQNATLNVIDLGEYKLYLTAAGVMRFADAEDQNGFWASSIGLDLVKDNKSVSGDGVNFFSAVSSGFANYYLDPQKINSYFKLYKLRDCYVVVFGMVNNEEFGWESNFFGIKEGKITKLFGLDGHGWFVNAPLDLENGGYNILIDTENSVRYEFCPDNFEKNPYEGNPHFTKSDYISTVDSPMYNGKAAEKVTLCKKMIGGETVRLLAHDAEPVTVDGVERVKFSELFLSMDASNGTSGWVKQIGLIGGPGLITARLDDYLTTIEFNDGKKLIAVYQSFDEGSPIREYAVFYDASNGNAFHAGPPNGASIVSGDHWYLGTNYTVSDTDLSITLDYGEVMVFDFDKVQFYNPELQ